MLMNVMAKPFKCHQSVLCREWQEKVLNYCCLIFLYSTEHIKDSSQPTSVKYYLENSSQTILT